MNLTRLLLASVVALTLSPFAWGSVEDCQFNLSQPVVDYGLMNRAIRADSVSERNLGERRSSLTLTCSKPTDMSLFYRAMAATSNRFHFAERGTYQLHIRDAVLDGQSVELGLIAAAGQAPAQTAAQLVWRPEHGVVPVQGAVPIQGRTFSAQLEWTAWVQEQGMQVRDAVTWEVAGVFDAVSADRSREATLRARFAPAACEAALSNGGVVDFGSLTINDLNADKSTRLPARSLNLRVGCDGPTAFALIMHDNRAGSATVDSDFHYGLGTDARNNKIGFFALNIDPASAHADSFARLYRTDSAGGNTGWSSASANPIAIAKTRYLSFTDSAGSSAGPTMMQTFNASITVDAVIAPLNNLDLSNAIDLDGAGTIEIIYL